MHECSIALKNEMIARIKQIIASWDHVPDIYALSLFVYDKNDNPCEPTFTLGYNTDSNYINSISAASSLLEARWNYAFWLQNSELVFGENETSELVKQWIIALHLPYFTYQEMFETSMPDNVENAEFEKITCEFINVLIAVVQELHETGFIERTFSKRLPIIIHELEYYDIIAKQNMEANGHFLVQGFIDFMNE